MDETEWIALLVILNTSLIPVTIVYAHGYGSREGWTWIFDNLVNKNVKNVLGFPSLFVLFYFVTIQTFAATAAFLVVKILHEQQLFTMTTLDDSDARIQDVVMGVFLTNSALMWLWLKSFFNPPPATFPALVLSIMLIVAWIVSLPYYYDIHQEPHGNPLETHSTPLVFAIVYFIIGPCILLLVSFYLFSNSNLKNSASDDQDKILRDTLAKSRDSRRTNDYGFYE